MKPENLHEAIAILSRNHSNQIIINKSNGAVGNTGTENNPTLHIIDCTPSAIKRLMNNGFSLSMNDGLMNVMDFAKPKK